MCIAKRLMLAGLTRSRNGSASSIEDIVLRDDIADCVLIGGFGALILCCSGRGTRYSQTIAFLLKILDYLRCYCLIGLCAMEIEHYMHQRRCGFTHFAPRYNAR